MNDGISVKITPLSKPQLSFGGGRLSWRAFETEAIQNEVLNRSIIDILGYEPWVIALGRNKAERIERLLDTFAWFGIAIGLPLLIQRPLSNIYHQMLKKRFNLFGDANPLTTSFKTLAVARNQPKAQNKLKKSWGLSNGKNLHTLGKWVLGAKLAIMTVDLFFMAAKNEIYFWGRNWLTKKNNQT
jgi:hypothetical protein